MFVPVVASTIATAIMFLLAVRPELRARQLAAREGRPRTVRVLQEPNGALYSIVVMTVWGWIGFDVIIYLAALQGVPQELIEAAKIDGARSCGIFRSVTCRCSARRRCSSSCGLDHQRLQLFDEIYFLTKGGPVFSTYVLVYYLFDLAFQQGIAGYAAAIAYVLFVGDPGAHRDPVLASAGGWCTTRHE